MGKIQYKIYTHRILEGLCKKHGYILTRYGQGKDYEYAYIYQKYKILGIFTDWMYIAKFFWDEKKLTIITKCKTHGKIKELAKDIEKENSFKKIEIIRDFI